MRRSLLSLVTFVVFAISVQAMSYEYAQREALYLTDKMAYELRLSTEQMNAVYEINLDYLLNVNMSDDIYGIFWERRNSDLRYVLSTYQYRLYRRMNYFYRPLNWVRGAWTLNIYGRYTDRHLFYYNRPSSWGVYRGGRNVGTRSYYQGRNFYAPNQNGPMQGHVPAPATNRGFRNGNGSTPPPTYGNGHRPGQGFPPSNGNNNGRFGNNPQPNTAPNTRPAPNTNNRNNANGVLPNNNTGSRSSNGLTGQGERPRRSFGSH